MLIGTPFMLFVILKVFDIKSFPVFILKTIIFSNTGLLKSPFNIKQQQKNKQWWVLTNIIVVNHIKNFFTNLCILK